MSHCQAGFRRRPTSLLERTRHKPGLSFWHRGPRRSALCKVPLVWSSPAMIWVPGQRTGAKFLSPKSLARSRVARPSTARSRETPWPAESETAAPSGRQVHIPPGRLTKAFRQSPARIRSVVPAGRLISPRPTRLSFSVKPAGEQPEGQRSVVWCAVQVVAFDEESSTPTVWGCAVTHFWTSLSNWPTFRPPQGPWSRHCEE